MNRYELTYIIDTGLEETARKELIEKISQLIAANGGEVEKVDETWGKRRLAYAINYKTEGWYVLVTLKAPSALPREIEQITAPREVVFPRVPNLAVIVPGGLCVPVVQHGIQGHLKCNVHAPGVPSLDADCRAQSTARAFTAHHQLIVTDTQLGCVCLHIQQGGKTIVQRGGIGGGKGQPIPRRDYDCAELLHQIDRTGHMHHFLHAEEIAAAVNP